MKNENNSAVWIVLIVLIIFLIFGGFGMMGFGNYRYGMMNWFYPTDFGFMGIFMSLICILIIVALVLLISWFIGQLQMPKHRGRK